MKNNYSDEIINILRILSRGNEKVFEKLVNNPPDRVNRWVTQYKETIPLVEELKVNGIKIDNIEDLMKEDLDSDIFKRAVIILVNWLIKDDISYHLGSSIMLVLLTRSISKGLAFDVVLEKYRHINKRQKDEWGYNTDLDIMLGNAIQKWMDDEHASYIFRNINTSKFHNDIFLIESCANLKDKKNKEHAVKILLEKLNESNLPNVVLVSLIKTLRKMKVIEAKEKILQFIDFPNNYKRSVNFDSTEYGHITDSEVRIQAKKAFK